MSEDSSNRTRVLVVDDDEGSLSRALAPELAGHTVTTAHDVVEAIHHINCAVGNPFDIIFCDVACGDVTGPELWAYLSQNRKNAAQRMVFVAREPVPLPTRAFLAAVPNAWVQLPLDRTPRGSSRSRHPGHVA